MFLSSIQSHRLPQCTHNRGCTQSIPRTGKLGPNPLASQAHVYHLNCLTFMMYTYEITTRERRKKCEKNVIDHTRSRVKSYDRQTAT